MLDLLNALIGSDSPYDFTACLRSTDGIEFDMSSSYDFAAYLRSTNDLEFDTSSPYDFAAYLSANDVP